MGYHSYYLFPKVAQARERLKLELNSPETEPVEGGASEEGEMKADSTAVTMSTPPPGPEADAGGAKELPPAEQKK